MRKVYYRDKGDLKPSFLHYLLKLKTGNGNVLSGEVAY